MTRHRVCRVTEKLLSPSRQRQFCTWDKQVQQGHTGWAPHIIKPSRLPTILNSLTEGFLFLMFARLLPEDSWYLREKIFGFPRSDKYSYYPEALIFFISCLLNVQLHCLSGELLLKSDDCFAPFLAPLPPASLWQVTIKDSVFRWLFKWNPNHYLLYKTNAEDTILFIAENLSLP